MRFYKGDIIEGMGGRFEVIEECNSFDNDLVLSIKEQSTGLTYCNWITVDGKIDRALDPCFQLISRGANRKKIKMYLGIDPVMRGDDDEMRCGHLYTDKKQCKEDGWVHIIKVEVEALYEVVEEE
jgi:hypothetical protein